MVSQDCARGEGFGDFGDEGIDVLQRFPCVMMLRFMVNSAVC